ncbi:exo-alpha-sialidase [Actinacidiphila oryziradicis]|uniref:exo-alpha-sialidase n=1 Tax=Actinacidiphila oryziradicis TaxID=2571141 RepID=UPI0023F17822|nr:exo-alpha-sialidase [Actinacidiphila oryziradicis]MCW2875369.1 putative secreted endo,4-beta-glucanase [Actinacidiphila oryziradicis]
MDLPAQPFTRRGVLAGTAATAALAALPFAQGRAQAADNTAAAAAQTYRWRNVAIGGTGFVTGVVFHPRERGLAYARTDIGGAYRWDERTARWIPLIDQLGWDDWNLLGVEAIAIDPAHPERVYLALGTYSQSWATNGAILRSDDQGAGWTRTDLTVKLGANEDGRGAGERLLVDPRDADTLWLGTRHDGLWKSADRGATWAQATAFPPTGTASGQGITFLAAAGRAIYAGWGDGDTALYRTKDGTAWEAVPGRPTGTAAKVPQHAVYSEDGHLYVTYANAPGPNNQSDGSVHKLNTATGTWTEVTPVQPGGTTSDGSADTFGYAGLSVDARKPGTVVVSTNNRWADVDTLFRSTDGGRSWKSLKDTAVLDVSETPYLKWGAEAKFGWWIQAVAIDPFDSQHIVYGTGATLYGTRDLKHWAPQIRGLEETAVTKLLSPPTGTAHLLSALGDIGGFYHDTLNASPAAGMSANPIFGSTTGLDQAALKPSYLVRTGWSSAKNGAYSTDGGQTWTPFAAQPDIASNAPGPVAVSADSSAILWSLVHWDGTTYPTQRSTDNGAGWAEVTTAPKGAPPVADPADPTRFYAYDTTTGTVYISTDSGATFTAGATGLPSGDTQFKIAAAPGRNGDLWLSAKWNGLYRSTDGGKSFTKVSGPWASYTLGFGKAAPGAAYPAVFAVLAFDTTTCVFRSDDEGATWTRINDDAHQWGWIGQTITGDPRVHGRVYLGTNGRGIQYGDPQ